MNGRHGEGGYVDEEMASLGVGAVARSESGGTTTHGGYGSGAPRLVVTAESAGWAGGPNPPEFDLREDRTTIGSASDNDIVLDGLRPHQAVIEHTDSDEYRLSSLGETAAGAAGDESPNKPVHEGSLLRSGASVTIGPWVFAYVREEGSDHGRPFGGRLGGEGRRQEPQPPKPAYPEEDARP